MGTNYNLQALPAPTEVPRVETGALQFGNDWPGLFIRGDNASRLMHVIQQLNQRLTQYPDRHVADLMRELTRYAVTIKNDVIV